MNAVQWGCKNTEDPLLAAVTLIHPSGNCILTWALFSLKILGEELACPLFLSCGMSWLKRMTANSLAKEACTMQTQTDLVYTKYCTHN